MWLDSWAYATSPYGLGLTSEQSWKLTQREFEALKKVHAEHIVLLKNAPHFYRMDKKPWTYRDILGISAPEQDSQSDLAVLKAQMFMMTQKPEELEALGWAVGPYKGSLLKNAG